MKELIINEPDLIGAWVMEQQCSRWLRGRGQAIGLVENGQIIAGTVFEGWNGASLHMHVAALPDRHWATKKFITACFRYPFNQLGCEKVIAQVGSSNEKSRRFVEHVGFVLEATLKDAYPKGDLLLYTLAKADCRWLT